MLHDEIEVDLVLSREEQALVLGQATVPESLRRRLRFGLRQGARMRFSLSRSELAELEDGLFQGVALAQDRATRRRLGRLHEHVAEVLRSFNSDSRATEETPVSSRRRVPLEDIKAQVRDHLAGRSFESMEEVNASLREFYEAHNRRPQAELGGLSPLQVEHLIHGEWDTATGLIQLSTEVPAPQLAGVPILHNAQVFLNALVESGGTRATQAGNLNRKFVGLMLGKMLVEPDRLARLREFNKVINEEDVLPLHVLRIVLEQAKLVTRRGGEFKVTRKGRQHLAEEEAAGELFKLLFMAYFRRFNLGYLDRLPDYPGIQATMGFSLYMVGKLAGEWVVAGDGPLHVLRSVAREQVAPRSP